MANLVVNADDYGLTAGVSKAIVRAHRHGVVTSTSVMTAAPAFRTTIGWLDDVPDLGVGLHLTAVGEDAPLLSAAEVPTLVDRRGRLALSSVKMVPRLALGRVDPADLEREFTAQYEALRTAGHAPTHLDTHHNLHLWPMVGAVVVRLAARWEVPVVRLPWSRSHSPTGVGIRRFARTLRGRLDHARIGHTADYFGIDEAGHLDRSALLALVRRLPADPTTSVEIAVHPGEADDDDLARYPWPGARRDAELEALTAPAIADAVRAGGHHLVPHRADASTAPEGLVDRPADGPGRDGTLTA